MIASGTLYNAENLPTVFFLYFLSLLLPPCLDCFLVSQLHLFWFQRQSWIKVAKYYTSFLANQLHRIHVWLHHFLVQVMGMCFWSPQSVSCEQGSLLSVDKSATNSNHLMSCCTIHGAKECGVEFCYWSSKHGISSYYPGSAIMKKSTTQDLYFAMTSRSVGSS